MLNRYVVNPSKSAAKYLGNQVLDMVDPKTKETAPCKEALALFLAVGLDFIPYCSSLSTALVITVASVEGLKAADKYTEGKCVSPLLGFFRPQTPSTNVSAANAEPLRSVSPVKKAM